MARKSRSSASWRSRAHSAGSAMRVGQKRWALAPTTIFAMIGGTLALWLGNEYGWIEVTAVGVLSWFSVLFALLMTIGRSSYKVELNLGEQQVKVGERAFGRIDVENVGRRRVWPAIIELPVGRGQAEFSLPVLAPGRTHDELFVVPTKKRGVIDVGPVKSVRSDPLGIVRREVVWTTVEKLYVHPQTVLLHGASAGVLRDLEGQTLRTVNDSDMNFHALREYVPGDDRRSIHWKSSARMQLLMVRQFEDTRRTHTALHMETAENLWSSEEAFELGVSVFASIGLNTIRGGMERTFYAGSLAVRSTTPQSFLNNSAGIELHGVQPDYVPGIEKIARDVPQCSLAFVVTGAGYSAHELHESLAKTPVGLRTIFVHCEPGIEPAVNTLGSTTFVRLGALEELPKALRMAVVS